MITDLKSIARAVTPIALDIYDKEDTASLLAFLAQIVPNQDGDNPLSLEWWSAFPELRRWIGERTVQKAFQDALMIRSELYEITMEYDRRDAEKRSALVKAEGLAKKIGEAFARGKVLLAYRVLVQNRLSYDGQDFFDVDHKHPDGTPFSNLLEAPRADPASPTVVEARAELKLAQSQLLKNRLVRNQLVSTADIQNALVVITRSQETWSAFRDLNTEERIGLEPNRFRNTFTILRDFNPPSEQESSVDFIEALPGGPRPVVFVETREPKGLEFDQSKAFSHNLIPFGMDGEYGVAAGFPQTAVRIRPAAE